MVLKILGRDWECNNLCGSNCCSEIFLPMPELLRKMFEEKGFWIVSNNYTDFEWLSFHKSFIIEKLPKGFRKLSLKKDTEYKFIYNPYKKMDEIYVIDKCDKLLSNNKCKVYRARPSICRKAKCIVYDTNPEIKWYAENGLLKDKVKK